MKELIGIIFCFLLIGCSSPNEDTNNSDANLLDNELTEAQQSLEIESPTLPIANGNDHFENEEIPNIPSASPEQSGDTYIDYPIFTKIHNEEIINQLILDYITELESYYNIENANITYQVTFQSDHFISIYFSGDLNSGAYPRPFKSTLNLDLQQGKRMTLDDIIHLDDQYMNQIINLFKEQFDILGVDMNSIFPSGIEAYLADADTSSLTEVQSYFNSNELILILSVPHAIGDYTEVKILISALDNFIF